MLACEQDPLIQQSVINQFTSPEGVSILTPYVYRNNTPTPQGNNNFTVNFLRSMGSHLMKVYWGCYLQNPAVNLVYDHSNLANSKISNYQTFINNKPIQPSLVNPANGDDWLMYRNRARERDILSLNEHLYCWANIDDFTMARPLYSSTTPSILNPNIIDGLDMDFGDVIYSVNSSSNAALQNYVFGVMLRRLHISAEGIAII